ncbi:hypothetical protein NBO_62g0013 [Nosema bombycis CQ1]|uniref:Uncharacterized protein n=1 Tax=Nosema bombycis (strain CQ1 / CVCC 102059) TaxID=578461 RepID=R0MLL5_NOSB1|nr:hypothetical protein NBO_62g0013 [Nosema bombycis CQ1]|eukprot:EOB13723.1 hypothetical protein NBO_62g0013 [Nosema bombycis CQ1]
MFYVHYSRKSKLFFLYFLNLIRVTNTCNQKLKHKTNAQKVNDGIHLFFFG